jgi:hypothetical protein
VALELTLAVAAISTTVVTPAAAINPASTMEANPAAVRAAAVALVVVAVPVVAVTIRLPLPETVAVAQMVPLRLQARDHDTSRTRKERAPQGLSLFLLCSDGGMREGLPKSEAKQPVQ